MNSSEIGFDIFVDKFFNNKNGTKMVLELTLEPNDESNDETTVYDIHVMLLQMFFIGIAKYEVPFNQMQNYFNNINIKVYTQNFTVKQLIEDSSGYSNRYLRVNDKMEMIKNGSYLEQNDDIELSDIKSFYTNDDECNLCIYFDHMKQ